MAKNNKADMSCARVKKYTASDVSKAERHNERKNETYENMNVIVERIPFNVHFKKPTAPTYMEQLKQMETDGQVSLRGLRKDATLFNEIVIDVNTMYFERNGSYEYAKQFYEEAYHFIVEKFGADNVATVKTDFVGSQMSSSLAVKSIVLAFVTLLLIWLYATIRFHWDFALGSIIALVHDCLIMFTFITWTQIEFSTTTLAAILTIFGYSINATVVILDRLRENTKTLDTKNFSDILNISISETMTRSIITTVTTLFAAIALLVFTKGSIKTFAEVLTVGLVSGCYSSIFISSGFIEFVRRNWNGENKKKSEPNKNVLTMTDAQ